MDSESLPMPGRHARCLVVARQLALVRPGPLSSVPLDTWVYAHRGFCYRSSWPGTEVCALSHLVSSRGWNPLLDVGILSS